MDSLVSFERPSRKLEATKLIPLSMQCSDDIASENTASQAPGNESASLTNSAGYAAYPLRVLRMKILGYIKDVNDISYSRDIGRPFHLFGNTYLYFGDTFCKNANGDFVGCMNNTVAIVPDKKQPLATSYLEIEEDGMVRPFIPLNEEEVNFEKSGKGQIKLWAFGGVVQIDDVTGVTWYQKSIYREGHSEYLGTGVALVMPQPQGKLSVQRVAGLVFGPDEPRVGTFTAILEGSDIYLYGDIFTNGDTNIILARVSRNCISDKGWYRYWNGTEYVKDYNEAVPVMKDLRQGSIIRSRLFGAGRPWIFVGCNKWADSQVLIGASAALEGPWELTAATRAQGIDFPVGGDSWMYCMYPHLWASDEKEAELMVTWSEKWPGGVVAAKLKFAAIGDAGC